MERNLNNLLSFLRSSNVVELVRKDYEKYNNDAPAKLIELEIEELQKFLSLSPKEKTLFYLKEAHRYSEYI